MIHFTITSLITTVVAVLSLGYGVPVQAQVMDFESLGNLEEVGEFYDGGFGGDGTGPGPDYGVSFENALAIISTEAGGTGNFTNAPSGHTVLFFQSGTASTMNVSAGFFDGFSFFYSSIGHDGEVRVWDGLNATGNLLATLFLTPLGGCSLPGLYCNWEPVGVTFLGMAMSVEFGGTANTIGFDDITLGSAVPGDPSVVPEPIIMVLLGPGLVGVAAARRRRPRHTGDEAD